LRRKTIEIAWQTDRDCALKW